MYAIRSYYGVGGKEAHVITEPDKPGNRRAVAPLKKTERENANQRDVREKNQADNRGDEAEKSRGHFLPPGPILKSRPAERQTRITSYNVCYTKLLRTRPYCLRSSVT